MRLFLSCTLLFAFCVMVKAQSPQAMRGGARAGVKVIGKVTAANTKKGLDAVSVQLLTQMPNRKTGGIKDTVLAGMFTRSNGDFSFENIPLLDSITVYVSAIGYGSIEQKVALKPSNALLDMPSEINLGNIEVQAESRVLGNVTVTATKPVMEMAIDRRVFNVEKSITATGGTAIDVMRNIPSVTVDVDGNVSLRNASPQIFVDGRPTILTLDQIPADNIEKVELITNPSAKFDAASSGGIINVVLKKNKRLGMNGNVSVSAGVPRVAASNLSLNIRQGSFNFFISGNYNQSGGNADAKTFRQNKVNGQLQNYFNQETANDRLRRFRSLRFGADYFINNRNTLTISQSFVSGRFTNNETQTQEFLNADKVLSRTGTRFSDGEFGFDRSGTQAVYIRKFAKTGHQLSADVTYNKGSGLNNSNIVNSYFFPDGTPFTDPNRVVNSGENNNTQITAQLDYVNPIGENAKFEAGLRTYSNDYNSVFDAFSLNQTGVPTKLPLSNHIRYKEVIQAAYVAYSNKIEKLTYQAGLRFESTDFDGEQLDRDLKFGYTFPASFKNIWDGLFPSLFITRTLGQGQDMQVNYSRRIRRPNFWQISPFVNINDPLNIRQGNPGLRPEFTNSFELNYNKNYSSGNFLGALYFRNTTNDVVQYSDTITRAQFEQLNNAAVDPNAILNTFINAQYQNRMGADLTLQQRIGKNLEIIPNLNLQYRKVKAQFDKIDLSNQGFNWEGKLIVNYKFAGATSWLLRDLNFQLTGEYESPEVIPQGRRKEQYSVDFALRKDFLKDKKGTITFGIEDVFNTRRWGTIYDTENFYQDSYRRWNVRNFRITFSYKFGNPNFSLFKRNRGEQGRDENEGVPM